CSTTTANRVYAIRASNGAVAWTYNLDGSASIDYASEGCAIDYTANRIYCAFNQPAGAAQKTLVALSTTTASAGGTVAWSVNAGALRTRPAIRGNSVIVATYDGWLRSRSITNN